MDLPPNAPPQALQQQPENVPWGAGPIITGQSAAFSWRIYGAQSLTAKRLSSTMNLAETPEQAAQLLQAAYLAEGYLLTNVSYVQIGADHYFYVHEGSFNRVEAPQHYQRYFKPLAKSSPLTANSLRRRLSLADIHARRAGEQLTVDYKTETAPTEPRYFFNYLAADVERLRSDGNFTVAFSNSGSRFLGR